MAWISPPNTGASNTWVNKDNIKTYNTTTYARGYTSITYTTYREWITARFDNSPLFKKSIRYRIVNPNITENTAASVVYKVEISPDGGSYEQIHEGTIPKGNTFSNAIATNKDVLYCKITIRSGTAGHKAYADIYYIQAETFDIPSVTTVGASSVSQTGATLRGSITNTGGQNCTSRGFFYKIGSGGTQMTIGNTGSFGTGEFTRELSGLNPATTYYYQAFAYSPNVGTGTGVWRTFTTQSPPSAPSVTVSDATKVTVDSAQLNGRISSINGATCSVRGFQWKKGVDGTVYNVYDSGSFGVGDFNKTITGLDDETEYYFRSYATNAYGTTYSSSWKTFTTLVILPPSVDTLDVEENTHNSAILRGEVTFSDERPIIEVGFEYRLGVDGELFYTAEQGDDFGEEEFELPIFGLIHYAEYHYRAYAKSDSGKAYGEWKSFWTDASIPVVETLSCSGIRSTSVTANARLISTGGKDCTERGFCYTDEDRDPDTNDTKVNETSVPGFDIGDFSLEITGLTPNTNYRIRSYVINEEGIAYGSSVYITGYVFTPNATTYFTNFFNKCYIVNGVDGVVKYDGQFVNKVGITPPETQASGTASGSGSGLGAGDYKFVYTFVDYHGYESNPSPDSDAIPTSAEEKITLTIGVSEDPKIVKRNIYRTAVNGGTYYYDGTVDDNTSTSYESTKADIALGSLLEIDHYPPPEGSHLIAKKGNRILIGYKDDLVLSKLVDVEYFPPDWFIKTSLRQTITGIAEQLDTLPVFTENSVERLLGTDEDNFVFKNAYSKRGCYAPRSVVSCENIIVFLSSDGIYYFDGEHVGSFNLRLNRYVKENVNLKYIHKAAGVYYNHLYMVSYPKGNSTVNNETIYVNIANRTTGIYDFAFSCYSNWDRGGDNNELFGGSVRDGTIYQIDNNLTKDENYFINCQDETDFMDFGYPEVFKQFYHVYIKVKSTQPTVLTMYYTLDDNEELEKDIAIEADRTRWYKIDLEGGGQRGRAIKLRPYINDPYDVTFCGYMIVFDIEGIEYA